jgi:hypothetical protein
MGLYPEFKRPARRTLSRTARVMLADDMWVPGWTKLRSKELLVGAIEWRWCTRCAKALMGHGTEGPDPGSVVHGTAALAIFLVINVQADGVSRFQVWVT